MELKTDRDGLPGQLMNLLSHFSRITTPGRSYIPQLDGLRFFGILFVIAYHVQKTCLFHFGVTTMENETVPHDPINQLISAGSFSVLMFFTMSGFILVVPFVKHYQCSGAKPGLGAYYWRRVTRVEPPYMIHLVFLVVLSCFVLRRMPSHPGLYQNDAWAGFLFKHMFPSFFYANGFVFAKLPYPNKVLWSLETEIQFYLVAPLLALLFLISNPRWRRGLLISLIVATSFVTYFIPQTYLLRFLLVGNLQFFLSGFLLADLYLTTSFFTAKPGRGSLIWDLMFVLTCAGIVLVYEFPALGFLMTWLMFALCLTAFKGLICSRALGNPWVTTIGGMCYTIYMYHWLLISALYRVTGGLQTKIVGLDLIIQFVVMTPPILLVSAIFFFLFERPFMQRDWPARVWKALRGADKKLPAPQPS